ncbi:hypothetical protein [Streptomyces sp. NPDC005438]|uniref:hypothetical protein n=1 Tax=Streptomyces sp. NPDC005438 TaxID=3156880 RepID=UPI0033BACE8E
MARLIQCVILGSVVGGVALPMLAPLAGIEVGEYLRHFLGWQLAVTAVLVLGGMALLSVVEGRLDEAVYADGHESVGRIDKVIITSPGGGEADASYDLMVSAVAPGPVTIHRRITWGTTPANMTYRTGHRVRIRHNTLDPGNSRDVMFVEFLN